MSQTPGWSTPGQPGPWGQPGQSGQPGESGPAGWGAAPPPLGPGTPWGGPPPAPRPGVVPLRPLGVGEILDASITYIRRNPRATLGLAAVVAIVTGVIQILLLSVAFSQVPSIDDAVIDDSGTSSSFDLAINGAQAFQGLLSAFLTLVATGLLTFVMSQAVLGRSVSIGEAWTRVRPLFWRLIGVALMTGLIVTLAIVACLLPGLLLLLVGLDAVGIFLLVVGGIGAVCLVVWLFVGLSLAPSALVLERLKVLAALRRSWSLVKGSFWRILGISLLASVLANIIASIVSVPFGLVSGLGTLGFGASGDTALFVGIGGGAIGSTVASIITLPFTAGVTTLLYIDRRMRREGLDLELARAAGVAPTAAPASPSQPAPDAGPGPTQQW